MLQQLRAEAQSERTRASSRSRDRQAAETLLLSLQRLHDPLCCSILIALLYSLLLPSPAEEADRGERLPLDVRVDLCRLLLQLLRESLQQQQREEYSALPPFFIPARLCDIIAVLLLQRPQRDELTMEFVQLQLSAVLCLPPSASTLGLLTSSLRGLRRLLQAEAVFAVFLACDGIAIVSRLVIPSVPDQAFHYALAFVLLICSVHAETHDELLETGCVGHVLRMLAVCRLDKRVRLYLGLLLQLMTARVPEREEQLMEAGLPSLLSSLSHQHWRDDDVPQLLSSLSALCSSRLPELSSWDHFRSQLLTCSLHPSLPHSSPAFFAAHLHLFAANHCAAVKRLCTLAVDGRASLLTRCLAVWDLGEIAAVKGEQGKQLLETQVGGLRQLLLQLMETAEERPLRRAAVTAMQKLLVPHWDEFRQRCRLETAVAIVRPVREEELTYGLQLLQYKSMQWMGGWPG